MRSNPMSIIGQSGRAALLYGLLACLLTLLSVSPAQAQTHAFPTTPSLDLGSVLIRARNLPQGWLPLLDLRLNGPIESGAALIIEYSKPNQAQEKTAPWISFELPPEPRPAYRRLSLAALGQDLPAEQASREPGPVELRIRILNELSGLDQQLFKGRFIVRQAGSGWYVDQDWRQPLVTLTSDWYPQANSDAGNQLPPLLARLWLKGSPERLRASEARLLHEGKLIASRPAILGRSTPGPDPASAWQELSFNFAGPQGAIFWNTYDLPEAATTWILHDHPGAYELQVLQQGKPVRKLGFKISPEGRIVPHGHDAALGMQDGWHFPLQILDAPWRAQAWQSEAFYANPPAGFLP